MAATARQFEILRLLRAGEGLTLLSLSKRLGVAKNTVQREVDHLCTAGVGITEKKQGQTMRLLCGRRCSLRDIRGLGR